MSSSPSRISTAGFLLPRGGFGFPPTPWSPTVSLASDAVGLVFISSNFFIISSMAVNFPSNLSLLVVSLHGNTVDHSIFVRHISICVSLVVYADDILIESDQEMAPFLDAVNTLLYPILPLNPVDYEEFGYPLDLEDFLAIRKYSPYENIKKDALYPSVLVTSSFNTRFGVWEAAKWVARVREMTIYDPLHPVVLNLTADLVEDSKYLQIKELAMETAFLIRMVADTN
ncbi:hypothetical protein KFK09_014661 [Dendrobium nobile]|uniref:Uncharacterized protein n=1 Tax=Dendrobium nobile TaxID=94219 RepID=A0A8T3B3S0_DENNO|nr:hypothetical protein KFK09_014661 [Dendrobium nobile]